MDIEKNYQEFRALDHEHGGSQKAYCGGGYVMGMKKMREEILKEASASFMDHYKDQGYVLSEDDKEWLESTWTAARLSSMKEIEELKNRNTEMEKFINETSPLIEYKTHRDKLSQSMIIVITKWDAIKAEKFTLPGLLNQKLLSEIEEFKQYKEMWQSVAGKANLKHLIETNEELKKDLKWMADYSNHFDRSKHEAILIKHCLNGGDV